MRKILLAVFILVSAVSMGQNPTNYLFRATRERVISHMVDSMLRIPRYNGTPSGVRVGETSAIDGAIAMDTTNSRLYIFSGNAWVRLAKYSELTSTAGIDDVLAVGQHQSAYRSIIGNGYRLDFDGQSEIYFSNQNGIYIDSYLDIDNFRFKGVNSSGSVLITSNQPSNLWLENTGLGAEVLSHLTTGTDNTGIGFRALSQSRAGSFNIAIGSQAMTSGTKPGHSIAIGYNALATLDTLYNIGIGENALASNVNGAYNTAVGTNSQASTTGGYNTSVGHESMKANTTGNSNVAVGQNSLWKNTTGIKNVALGGGAMENNTIGGFNVAVGEDALLHNTKGTRNIAIGWEPLGHIGANTGDSSSQNIAMGYLAGDGLYHGDNNVFIGHAAGYGPNGQEDTVTNSIAIGANSFTTTSNQIVIGNSSNTDFRAFGVSSGAGTKAVRYDPYTHKLTYSDTTTSGGSTPTLQQVLTAGSTLTGDNTVDGGGNNFYWNNFSNFSVSISGNTSIQSVSGSASSTVTTSTAEAVISTDTYGKNSRIDVWGDSLVFKPSRGNFTIDSLNSGSKNDSLVTWTKSGGAVKAINAGDLTRQRDTIPLFTFGGGGGQAGDTTTFSTSTIYGSFYNDKSDTLVITKMLIGLQGTSPDVTITVYYNDSLNVTAGATKLVNAGNNATNIYTGTSVTSFDNAKIPPGVWVWCKSTIVATKPTYLSVSLSGYKSRTL